MQHVPIPLTSYSCTLTLMLHVVQCLARLQQPDALFCSSLHALDIWLVLAGFYHRTAVTDAAQVILIWTCACQLRCMHHQLSA